MDWQCRFAATLARQSLQDHRAGRCAASGELCNQLVKNRRRSAAWSELFPAAGKHWSVPGAGNPRREIIRTMQHFADRKSTRLNSSHVAISYAVFCLKKKKIKINYHN